MNNAEENGNNNPFDSHFVGIENDLNKSYKNNLSSFFDTVEYIGLETNDTVLLGNHVALEFVSGENIFIRSGGIIYRFDLKGHFLNKIGCIGGGPKEYVKLYYVCYDDSINQLIFLVENKKIQFWNINGDFIKEVKLKSIKNNKIGGMSVVKNNSIAVILDRYNKNGVSSYLSFYNYDGQQIKKYLIYSDNKNIKVKMYSSTIMYMFSNELKYKSSYNDSLYSISDHRYLDKCLYLGKYSPDRKVIDDMDNRNLLFSANNWNM